MNITFSNQKIFASQQVNDLYTSVGWTAYTNDLPKLLRAISKSSLVISAWNGEELVGLIRALTDEETIAYIQDILVLPVYHKQGVGSELMRRILSELKGIRQIVLMTDQGEANLPCMIGIVRLVSNSLKIGAPSVLRFLMLGRQK